MNSNYQSDTPLTVALDIGTTKVCAVAGVLNEHGQLKVLGFGKVQSEGVLRGVISNIEKTVRAIRDAVERAERTVGHKFEVVHVGIAGQHIKSLQHRGQLIRDNARLEINQRDIDKLISDTHKLVLPPGDKIIHVIPQEYTVDMEQGIADPIGMSGIKLEANFHIITGQINAAENLQRCAERAELQVANLTLEPIASAAAVLSAEEKEAGVALVDIGGGTTDITIFQDGIIRHTAVIPFGGNVITKDIKEGCMVMKQEAEKLKTRFGSALADEVYENRIITISGLKGREPKEISEKNLARIIQARVEEIMDYVLWEVRRSGYESKLIGGIVLTGGGALLQNIDKLVEHHTGMTCRIGTPVEHLAQGFSKELSNPIFSTAIGLLLKGIEDVRAGRVRYVRQQEQAVPQEAVTPEAEAPSTPQPDTKKPWFENIFNRTKEWFEAEPDSEFDD